MVVAVKTIAVGPNKDRLVACDADSYMAFARRMLELKSDMDDMWPLLTIEERAEIKECFEGVLIFK